jgi:hypothetical protein
MTNAAGRMCCDPCADGCCERVISLEEQRERVQGNLGTPVDPTTPPYAIIPVSEEFFHEWKYGAFIMRKARELIAEEGGPPETRIYVEVVFPVVAGDA